MKFTPWIFGLVITLGVGAWAAQADNAQADSAQADLEDAAALSSREYVAQVICGPGRTAVWLNNYEHECLKELP